MSGLEERAEERAVFPFRVVGKRTEKRFLGLIPDKFVLDCQVNLPDSSTTGEFELEVVGYVYKGAQIGEVFMLGTSFYRKYDKKGNPVGDKYLAMAKRIQGIYVGKEPVN